MTDALEFSASAASLLAFFVVASGGIGSIAGGIVADRIGRAATAAAMMAVSRLCALTIGALTFVSIHLTGTVAQAIGWRWSFLVPGPVLGVVAMLVLRCMLAATRVAQGLK
ncbi:hypothetical protein DBIPINDM_005005 [Mesorhizobium sp. AR02]|uniref:hypothetical protein n=1 Tax=Mesorhizobium sp. AR02 TaxID=2865837 RepID=UPI00215EBC64|nr:hypothetical protein [Mesorhizobium sp. AR02]UVK51704.1 hypothetical protein DBIPINDM_005005 [Mesorhizobium sp. AR02]